MKQSICFIAVLFLGAALFAQEATPTPAAPSNHDVGYAFGLLVGQGLAKTGLEFDLDAVLQGLKAGLGQGKPLFDQETATRYANEAVKESQTKVRAAQVEKENKFLEAHSKVAGVTTTPSGLQFEVLKQGTGGHPTPADTVEVNYVGTLADGTQFDSSAQQGSGPVKIPLGQIIPGWLEGLQLMSAGGKYRLTVPSKLAYGARGAGQAVPPFSTLIFEVELVSFEPTPPPKAPTAELAPDPVQGN